MIPIIIIAIIFAWAIYGMHVLDLHKPALEALSKPVAEWFAQPGNPVSALLWIGALTLSLASWLSPVDTLFRQMLPDFISISIAVIVIDELVGYRNRLERKQEILEQVQSKVRDVAVEALRVAIKNSWFEEIVNSDRLKGGQFQGVRLAQIDLRGADLTGADLRNGNLGMTKLQYSILIGANLENANLTLANLQMANLWLANLQGAFLVGADLQGARLVKARLRGACLDTTNLEDATYDKHTTWPDNFDPVAAGAILIDEEG